MTRIAGNGGLGGLARLSGGANMESWAFDWAEQAYVLRRAPSAEYMADRPYGHADEAALVIAAHAAGVKAPEVVGVLAEGDGMGTGYVMRRVIAEVSPAKILGDPPPSLLADLGRELARIHAIPAAAIPDAIPLMNTVDALAELKARVPPPSARSREHRRRPPAPALPLPARRAATATARSSPRDG